MRRKVTQTLAVEIQAAVPYNTTMPFQAVRPES